MIRAIFLDIDNTLLDFDEYVRQSLREGFEKYGLAQYEPWMYDTFTKVNTKLWQQLERKELTFDELKEIRFQLIFQELGIEYDGPTFETFFREALNVSAIPIAGAYEMLEELSGEYILCAASNGPYEQQAQRLELAGMKKFFTHLFISEEIGYSKPSKEFFDIAMERLNARREDVICPEECLMVGDSLTSDIAGGKAMGMRTCFYNYNRKQVEDERIDVQVEDLTSIGSILRRS